MTEAHKYYYVFRLSLRREITAAYSESLASEVYSAPIKTLNITFITKYFRPYYLCISKA